MNCIADFYDVQHLRKKAINKIRRILIEFWNQIVTWYPTFLEATFKKTPDRDLYSLFVNVCLPHFYELNGVIFGQGADIDLPAEFFSSFLGKLTEDPSPIVNKNLYYEGVLKKMFEPVNCAFCTQGLDVGCDMDKAKLVFDVNVANQRRRAYEWDPPTRTLHKKCYYCFRPRKLTSTV